MTSASTSIEVTKSDSSIGMRPLSTSKSLPKKLGPTFSFTHRVVNLLRVEELLAKKSSELRHVFHAAESDIIKQHVYLLKVG